MASNAHCTKCARNVTKSKILLCSYATAVFMRFRYPSSAQSLGHARRQSAPYHQEQKQQP